MPDPERGKPVREKTEVSTKRFGPPTTITGRTWGKTSVDGYGRAVNKPGPVKYPFY
jgi:hypothetical protein